MAKKRREGTCHICGCYGPLSFEHIPPHAAFNDRPVIRVEFEQAMSLGPDWGDIRSVQGVIIILVLGMAINL